MAETLETHAAELEKGQASSVGLVRRAFQRIETFDSRLNSFVALDRSGALAAAKESDERRSHGRTHSRLDGIPISVKDNLHVAGFLTTWGSRALKDHWPAKEELPVSRIRQVGMIVIGKTNAPEFTFEGYTRSGLPMGAHLAAACGADDQLIASAREVSRANPLPSLPQLEAAL